MASMPIMILLGPCLMMGMSGLALGVVHRGFSRTAHALWWAAGSVAGALQWGVMAGQGLLGWPALRTGPGVDLLGLLSVLLLAGGFALRAHGRVPARMVAAGAGAALLLALLFLIPPMPIRAALTPATSVLLLGWAAMLVHRERHVPRATDAAVVATLLAVLLVHLGGAAAAIAEQLGWIASHRLYQGIYLLTVEPVTAAVALAMLMLIASDFSVELKRLLHTDPLTGVLNRVGLEHAVDHIAERGKARPLAIALADIDRFKQVNDRHGHDVGDAALACVAGHLAAGLGRDGLVARLGGEEFALVLPGCDAAQALERIEPLRRGLAALPIAGQPALRLSASFGIAQRAPGDTLPAMLERADVALYRSKRDGRDRTTVAAAPPGGGQ